MRRNFATPKKVMKHDKFIDRIRKTLYYGAGTENLEVSKPLAEYAADLFSEPHRSHSLNRLSCVAAGKIRATPCSLIMALIYLDRLNIIDPSYTRRITPQELFVVSLMISTKFYTGNDDRFNFDEWATEGNMTEDKLKEMELDFLTAIDWNIYISNEDFFEKLSNVERQLAQRQGLRRGWLTYSELIQLLPSFTLTKFLLSNIAVLALSYAASVITIAGAFFIASQVPGTVWYRRPATNDTATTTGTAGTATTVSVPVATPITTENATQAAPIIITTTTTTTNIVDAELNDSCNALNVEAELFKLQQQYCLETSLNDGGQNADDRRYNDLLPPPSYRPAVPHIQENHWLNIKSEYSDGNQNVLMLDHNPNTVVQFRNTQNVSLLWQLISDAMQQSYLIRWPQLWPKLI